METINVVQILINAVAAASAVVLFAVMFWKACRYLASRQARKLEAACVQYADAMMNVLHRHKFFHMQNVTVFLGSELLPPFWGKPMDKVNSEMSRLMGVAFAERNINFLVSDEGVSFRFLSNIAYVKANAND